MATGVQIPVAVAPVAISQHTAAAHGFKNARAFLEFVGTHKVPHVRNGKTVLVAADDLRAALRDLRVTCAAPALVPDVQPETADDVLRLVGMRRSA